MAMTLRLTDDGAAALRAAAAKEGRSMQEVAMTAVRQYIAKRDEFRGKQVARFLQEDAELLDLLSQ
jgi:predicted transcriptional regulator